MPKATETETESEDIEQDDEPTIAREDPSEHYGRRYEELSWILALRSHPNSDANAADFPTLQITEQYFRQMLATITTTCLNGNEYRSQAK